MASIFSVTNVLLAAIAAGVWLVFRAVFEILLPLRRIEEKMAEKLRDIEVRIDDGNKYLEAIRTRLGDRKDSPRQA